MLSHLIELRRRIIQIVVIFILLFVLFFIIAPDLFHALILPLLNALPVENTLIATHITTPLFTPIQLAANAAMLSTAPFALFHAWRFVSPGLYRQERNDFAWMIISSLLLFTAGVLFGFYLVLPLMFKLFLNAVPIGVRLMPDMGFAVDFITRMLLVFGLCFQVPMVCVVLVRAQLVTCATLSTIRPYIIVSTLTIGMLLTPPDVFSQLMLAIPLYLLYETGVLFARFSIKKCHN